MGWVCIITASQIWDSKFSYYDPRSLLSWNTAFGCLVYICAVLGWRTDTNLRLLRACRLKNTLIRKVGTQFYTYVFMDNYNVLYSLNQCRQKFTMESFLSWASWLDCLYRSNKMGDCQTSTVFYTKENQSKRRIVLEKLLRRLTGILHKKILTFRKDKIDQLIGEDIV